MINRPSQRVAVFIDTQNMYHSAKHLYGSRVNFPALVEAAVDNRELVRAIAYVAKSKTGEEAAFFEALTSHGIELKIKDVQEFASGEKKADWDVGMAVDAMAISPRVDAVVLVTGDGDFLPLVNYLKTNGIVCEAVAFGSSTNMQLREAVDKFIDLSETPQQFLLHTRHRAPASKSALDLESIFDPVADANQPTSATKPTRAKKSTRSTTGASKTLKEDDSPRTSSRNIRVTF